MPYPPPVSIRIRCWRGGTIEESTDVDQLGRLVAGKDSATWIDLTNPKPELVRAVARRLGLHPLLADDIVEHNERAKIQLVGEVIHVVAFVLERETTAVDALIAGAVKIKAEVVTIGHQSTMRRSELWARCA